MSSHSSGRCVIIIISESERYRQTEREVEHNINSDAMSSLSEISRCSVYPLYPSFMLTPGPCLICHPAAVLHIVSRVLWKGPLIQPVILRHNYLDRLILCFNFAPISSLTNRKEFKYLWVLFKSDGEMGVWDGSVWSGVAGVRSPDRKNEIKDTCGWNEFTPLSSSDICHCSFVSKGASWGGLGIWLGCLLGASLWRFSRHKHLGGDPAAEVSGGITYLLHSSSGSPGRSWKALRLRGTL